MSGVLLLLRLPQKQQRICYHEHFTERTKQHIRVVLTYKLRAPFLVGGFTVAFAFARQKVEGPFSAGQSAFSPVDRSHESSQDRQKVLRWKRRGEVMLRFLKHSSTSSVCEEIAPRALLRPSRQRATFHCSSKHLVHEGKSNKTPDKRLPSPRS